MEVSPRTPVIIGVGQVTNHPSPGERYDQRPHPLDLMSEALELAARDVGPARRTLESINELVAIGSFTWHPRDPALLVAQRLALSDLRTRLTPTGGNLPQKLVHESARRILRGEVETVAVVGAEAMNAHALARKEGRKVDWERQSDDVPTPEMLEEERIPFTSVEYEQGLTLPVQVYPLFENARRARLGWSFEQQRERLGTLWSHFAQVAATNPYAWLRTNPSPQEIVTPSASNRMVSFPYTKLLVANLPVDMGAAYIMTSFEHAQHLGVSRDALVFPEYGADATDHWFLSQRMQLDDSPAMREIWRGLEGFGAREEQLEHIDLYSCFPTVVQTACDVLGIDAFDPSRIPTVTGGLTFGGGPGNNYVTHSICSMVQRLRGNHETRGLVTGLGWFSTKHSWGTYATSPPANGFQWYDAQPRVDEQPECAFEQRDGEVVIETYTVSHSREGVASRFIAATRTSDNVRVWCHSDDVDVVGQSEHEEFIGQRATVKDGVVSF